MNQHCAIVGINRGDEGKGRMVDLLTESYDVAVRCQGGGHAVIDEYGKFTLRLPSSGIFRKGVAITPENLKISDQASLPPPWHRDPDALEEARLADQKYGLTKQGIAPFHSDKCQKKTSMAGEPLRPEHPEVHLRDLLGDLAAYSEFGMNKEKIEAALTPEKYTGPWDDQVENYLSPLRPIPEGITQKETEINV